MTNYSEDEPELFPRERISASERAELISEFERLLVISIKAGGGPHCVNAMEQYLKRFNTKREHHGYKDRRHGHPRAG